MTQRPSWTTYFLDIAEAVSKRGDCTRRQVGAVIADADHRIISTGYNGTLPGKTSCLKGACPRGRHFKAYSGHSDGKGVIDWCACGEPWPCVKAVEPGSSYDTGPGACIALHAEQNALLYAFRSVKGAAMYVTEEPCDGCLKLIGGAQIRHLVTPGSEHVWALPWTHDDDHRAPPGAHRADVRSRRSGQADPVRAVV